MKIQTTRQLAEENGTKVLAYGPSGAGKTRMCATATKPIVVSAEAGLMSLRNFDLPAVSVSSLQDVYEVYEYLNSDDARKTYEWVCVDSISEIAECVLSAEKAATKDARQAYGAMMDRMSDLIRAFRDLPYHVYISAKMERVKDDMTGALIYSPSMPGQRLAQQIPYFFDEVLVLRTERDSEGEMQRWLQTCGDSQYVAKDRSGALDTYEEPDLSKIARKIAGK